MATMAKPPKKKRRLGSPPPAGDASSTLEAPEVAPAAPERRARGKTGRVVPFGTKVTEEFKQEFRFAAFTAGKSHAAFLEDLLEMYKKNN